MLYEVVRSKVEDIKKGDIILDRDHEIVVLNKPFSVSLRWTDEEDVFESEEDVMILVRQTRELYYLSRALDELSEFAEISIDEILKYLLSES